MQVGTPLAERPLIIPKIEKPAALRNIDEILALSDGLMVTLTLTLILTLTLTLTLILTLTLPSDH